MQKPLSPAPGPGRRSPGQPLRLAGIAIVIVALMIVAFLLARRDKEAPSPPQPGPGKAATQQRSGYQNRGLWQTGASPTQRGAATRILGTVYDSEGRPVAGATVSATSFQVAGNQSTAAGSAKSDAQGRFALPLPDGTYYLACEKEGFGPTMALAHSGDDVGLILKKSGVVTGHVYDELKRPIRRFSIDVVGLSTDDMAAPAPFLSRQFDSPDGSFRLDQLPDRGVVLRATAPDHAPGFSSLLAIGPASVKEADITLATGCTMTGVVEDEEGAPLANVFVDAELRRNAGAIGATSFDAASEAESDSEGRFRLEHVPIGEIMVRAYDGNHAVTTITGTIETCDKVEPVRLRMSSGGGLEGTVTAADGKPIAGAKLTLMHRSMGFVNTLSDSEGHYRFDKLAPGGMRVEARRGTQRAVALVMITEGDVATRDLPFPAEGKGEIRGTITAAGQPLQGMQLLVAGNQGGGLMNMYSPVTGKDGSYRVTGLPDGLYAVLVSSSGQMAQTGIESGNTQTIDLEVGVVREPKAKPQRPEPGDAPRDLDHDRQE